MPGHRLLFPATRPVELLCYDLVRNLPGIQKVLRNLERRRNTGRGTGTLDPTFFARSDLRLPGFRKRTPEKTRRTSYSQRGRLPPIPGHRLLFSASRPVGLPRLDLIRDHHGVEKVIRTLERRRHATKGFRKPAKAVDMPGEALGLWPGLFPRDPT